MRNSWKQVFGCWVLAAVCCPGVVRGQAKFTFGGTTEFNFPNNFVDMAAGDFNGDGNLDIAVTNAFTNAVDVLLGNGAGGFTSAPGGAITVGTRPTSLVTADFNGDGKPDLAVASSGVVSIFLGDGSGGFTAAQGSPHPTNFSALAVVSAVAGDFNGDGRMDVAFAAGTNDPGTLIVFLGDGAGGLTAVPGSPSITGLGSCIAAGDFNLDGKLDLVVAGGQTALVLLGNGKGGFAPASGSPFQVGQGPSSIAVLDFNGDGKPDLAVKTANVTMLQGDAVGDLEWRPVVHLVSPVSKESPRATLTATVSPIWRFRTVHP